MLIDMYHLNTHDHWKLNKSGKNDDIFFLMKSEFGLMLTIFLILFIKISDMNFKGNNLLILFNILLIVNLAFSFFFNREGSYQWDV